MCFLLIDLRTFRTKIDRQRLLEYLHFILYYHQILLGILHCKIEWPHSYRAKDHHKEPDQKDLLNLKTKCWQPHR
jgi:hypothetical protein